MSRRVLVAFAALIAIALISGCVAGPNPLIDRSHARGVAGFWTGLWHGLICCVTFVISLFNKNVHVYEVHNNGAWYDLGFILGAGSAFGSGGRGSHRPKRDR